MRIAVAVFLLAGGLRAAEDPRLLAAEASLADGQPDSAMALLRDVAATRGMTRERLALVRAQWALGNPRSALLTLDTGPAADCALWPGALRGHAAELAAGLHLVLGEDASARSLLTIALANGRRDDPACLSLAAELAATAGDANEAQRLAMAAWRHEPRSAANANAGLLLARLLAEADPTAARTVLADVRAIAGLSPAQRVGAAEQLCRLLLPIQPGQCLVVAERESAQSPAESGALPLYRALALAALEADEAAAELAALPAELRSDPAVAAAEERLRNARISGQRADAGQRLERAAAAAELGRWDQVVALVGGDAVREPAALVLLTRCPGIDLGPFLQAEAARDPRAALALTHALIISEQPAAAWKAVQPALAAAEQGGDANAYVWAAEAARQAAPERVTDLIHAAIAAEPPCKDAGIAWCRLAEFQDSQGAPSNEAWLRGAEALSATHPWRFSAAARAARAILADGGDLVRAERVVLAAREGDPGADILRCRFLLAQIWARQGRFVEARTLATGLLPHGDEVQRGHVQAFIASLAK